MIRSFIIGCAAFFAVTGLMLDAIGSHALSAWLHQDPLSTTIATSWQSAVRIQLTHAIALVGLAALCDNMKRSLCIVSLFTFVSGMLLFSGSIYLKILLENPAFTRVAPTGGILLMFSWLIFALGVMLKPPRSP